MPKQNELDQVYIRMANMWGSLSKARRKKVGCLIVKDGGIISDGYNGTPSGFNNECEILESPSSSGGWDVDSLLSADNFNINKIITKPEVLHAETNAITKLAKSTQSSLGATMYITISPCVDCAKLIIQAGIERVVYKEVYRDLLGVELLEKAFIEVSALNYNYENKI